ncbi:MAG: hypothetical protein H7Y04_03060 [Verrucomicrobia bacterium]|nr:hypothetical protein [Cytophagales bacterium]
MKRFNFWLLIPIISCSCIVVESPSDKFIKIICKETEEKTNRLNFSGCYQKKFETMDYNQGTDFKEGKPTRYIDTPYVVGPIYFFQNGTILDENIRVGDSISYKLWTINYPKYTKGSVRQWGVYELAGDTIKAIIYKRYWGIISGRQQYRQTYYQGVLANDTILHWKIVQPLPKVDMKLNAEMFSDSIPVTLIFKPISVKPLINPEEAWIMEFKQRYYNK